MSVEANRQHLGLLLAKQERIRAAIGATLDAMIVAVSRGCYTPEEATELWVWSRSIGVAGASPKMADALGVPIATLSRWNRFPADRPGAMIATEGPFPLNGAPVPRRGTSCVYALLADGVVVYIGRTTNVKDRLKTHWREKKAHGIDTWRVFPCSPEELHSLELELIDRFSPRLNKLANRYAGSSIL